MNHAIPGFAFQMGDRGREIDSLAFFANHHDIPRRFFRRQADITPGFIPVGNVDWVEGALGRRFTPDYYPEFLSSFLHRKIWTAEKWPVNHAVFVKPADRYKRFTGFVSSGRGWKGSKRGPLLCSEPVIFTNEWRYYIADGKCLAAHWYAGDEINTPDAPEVAVDWPSGWCGAVDFGQLSDGRIALVESQHPFACGWYGRLADGITYAKWIAAGWHWINR